MIHHLKYLAAACLLAGCSGILAGPLVAQDALTGDFSKPAEIEKRLAAARADLQNLPADADPALRERCQQLEAACQFHLAAVRITAAAQGEQEKAVQAVVSWHGFPTPPPYSLLLLDEIRERLATLADAQRAAEVQLRIDTTDIEGARDKLDDHQQAERRCMETAASASDPAARQSAELPAKSEQVASRIFAEQVARFTLRLAAQRAELQMIQAKSQLAQLHLKTIGTHTAFPKKDLDDILQRIARDRAEAVAALVAASHNPQSSNPLLSWRIEFLDLEKTFWNTRFAALDQADAATAKSTLATFKQLKVRVDDWVEAAQLRLAGESTGVIGISGAVEIDFVQMRAGLQQVCQMQRRIGFAIADLEGTHRGTPVLDRISAALGSFWNAELYLAEETEIIDGKKSSTYRAVTPAKLARLALILTVGWVTLRFLSRRVRTIVSRKSNIPQTTADLAAKCAFGTGLTLLVIYGLNTVHIPFTVFAFLGGALAIGVGFGTQTLLKNFISGIILVFERPFKVGDVVEVDGITGRIKSIGLRASIVRHFDGIDSIIPNSALLENRVANWTFADSLLRHSITIGVAYGSPTRDVAHTLLAVAAAHGLVVDDPAPAVHFENIGDNTLLFRLMFWFDSAKTQRDPLASDLLFMIEKNTHRSQHRHYLTVNTTVL
ncbi:MAG: mechanosensitive ion channel [Verrucomicrobia bacterium]|nr:mechanosensitive ion channel [Verrucomicrobiota bacterium]